MVWQEALIDVSIALGILFVGFIVGSVTGRTIIRSERKKRKLITAKLKQRIRNIRYLIMIVSILTSLSYLHLDSIVLGASTNLAALLPTILATILIGLLGIVAVNVAVRFVEGLVNTFDLLGQKDEGKTFIIKLILLTIRIFLYLLIVEVTLSVLDIDAHVINTLITTLFYIFGFIAALILFFSFRAVMENFIGGWYIKASPYLKKGEQISVGKDVGEIHEIGSLQTIISHEEGNQLTAIPNALFLKNKIKIDYHRQEMKLLEELSTHFVQQRPSYCGPACAQMALSVWNFPETDQDTFAAFCGTEVGKGTHPEELRKAIESITKGDVLGQWIPINKISDLKRELTSWINDSALLIVDFKKNLVFPTVESNKAHYALCVGIDLNDLILLDPSGKTGGVYFANCEDMHKGMNTYSKLIKGKRGYLVLAKHGTTAYRRLSRGLLYADKKTLCRVYKTA